jgi:hypothetical protein
MSNQKASHNQILEEEQKMTSNIPAEANGLGAPTAEYTRNGVRQALNLVGSVFVISIGAMTMFGGLATALSGGGDAFLFIGLAVVYVLPGLWWFISTLRKRGLRVLVFPEGLAYTRRGKTDVIHWDDVATVLQAITRMQHTFTVRKCTVQLQDGSKYTFNNTLRNVEQLINTIQQQITPRILERVDEAYEAGQAVPFGKLSISQAGISKGSKTLPWDQVKRVTVDKGVITIRKQGGLLKWASVNVAETPNFFAFASMVGAEAPESVDLALLGLSMLGHGVQ